MCDVVSIMDTFTGMLDEGMLSVEAGWGADILGN